MQEEVFSVRKFVALILILALTLSGCAVLAHHAPQKLKSGDAVYVTGFYGSLFPHGYKRTGETVTAGRTELSRLKHDQFQLYHAKVGSYYEGTIYCAESDYEDALAFYSDPQNYKYYCSLENTGKFLYLTDVDPAQFDKLLAFAEQSDYDPFDRRHNAKIEKIDLPMPDNKKDVRLVFYKESIDHMFISSQGSEYYILGDQLYLVYQYDFGHGEYEKLIAVKVPEDLSNYFVEFLQPYM